MSRLTAVLLAAFQVLAVMGCRSVQVEGRFKLPAELTATAEAEAWPAPTPPAALEAVRFALASQFRVGDPGRVKLRSWERVDWRDGCLGVEVAGTACTEAVTPGYRLVLELEGDGTYEYHTNLDGSLRLLAAGPAARVDEPALTWEGADPAGMCQSLTLAADGLALVGPCGAPQMPLQLWDEAGRPEQLRHLLERFAPFEAHTFAGRVTFRGQGEEVAAPVWRQAIAEWAQLVQLELRLGRSGASWGLALAWQQEDGETGRCRNLQVEVYGLAFASRSRCEGGQAENLGRGWLSTSELETLYAWRAWLAPVAQPLPERLLLSGAGTKLASEAEVKAMREWAAALYARLASSDQVDGTSACLALMERRG